MIETFIVPAEQLVVWIFSISWIYWLNKPGDWRIHRNNSKLLMETFISKFSTSPTSFRTISVISVIVTRFSVSHPFLKLETKLMINFKMYLKQGCIFVWFPSSLHSENLLWGKLGGLTRDVAVARKITIRCVLYVRVH